MGKGLGARWTHGGLPAGCVVEFSEWGQGIEELLDGFGAEDGDVLGVLAVPDEGSAGDGLGCRVQGKEPAFRGEERVAGRELEERGADRGHRCLIAQSRNCMTSGESFQEP